jgi:hypothetical protein
VGFDGGQELDEPEALIRERLRWFDSGDESSALVCPAWWYESGTQCWVRERVVDSSVESESDCVFTTATSNAIFPGDWDNECTVTNTRIYEGVPTLSQHALAILALLIVGIVLVGFRRFV